LLNLTIPNGSMEPSTLKLFEDADLAVLRASERDYRATIDDARFAKVRFLRPMEIPSAVEQGHFDLGICETHSILDARADVVEAMDLGFGGRATGGQTRIVLAAPAEGAVKTPADLRDGIRVSTEYPNLAADYFAKRRVKAIITYSYGATEAKVPELADAIVELTESGSSFRRNGLAIVDELCRSSKKLIANKETWDDSAKRAAIDEIITLLSGVLQARGKVLLKMNVPEQRLKELIAFLPAMKAPTVSRLFESDYYAVETVAVKATVNQLIPELKKHGAIDILELPISKIVA
jgi:ATP phosphoribosyltransferase